MSAPNGPDHPAVRTMQDNWFKVCAILMAKFKQTHVTITTEDIERLGADGSMEKTVVLQELTDGLHIRLMTTEEAERFVRSHLN